jgi:general stress protein 26
MNSPRPQLDARFSEPDADATPWQDVEALLEAAELYWITTVRADGRPHVTPLVAVWHDGAMHFCTGLDEQKGRNLEHNRHVALTTGNNRWAAGLDVVVEGTAERVMEQSALQELADAYATKYSGDWVFEVGPGVFRHGEGSEAAVFRVEASKIMAFAKDPHAQTTFRFGSG